MLEPESVDVASDTAREPAIEHVTTVDEETLDGPSAPPAVQTMVVPPEEVDAFADPERRRGRLVPILTALVGYS